MTTTTTILLTGAAGRIGTNFYKEHAGRYRFRLADRDTTTLAPKPGDEAIAIDIADLDACRTATAGADLVLHLAADPSPEAEFASLLPNNLVGTANVFRAAHEVGARRIVFASSIHAVVGYPLHPPIPAGAPVEPRNHYGVTKVFGEALAAYSAYRLGLPAIAVRIGAYEAPWLAERPTPEALAAYVSPRDLNQLLVRALEAPSELRFLIAVGQSANAIRRMDLAATIAALGYDPQDDGFARYGISPPPVAPLQ